MNKRFAFSLLVTAALAGCSAVGPDYQRPELPQGASWQADLAAKGELAPWRQQFQDPALQTLIGTALESNRDLRLAALNVEAYEAKYRIQRAAQLPTLAASGSAYAQKKEVTFAHQDMLVPLRTVMESGELEKATGYKINFRLFGGGGDVIKAMASGDVQLGQVGSSPLTAAASQGQDIKLFWILDDIADAEALIARALIQKAQIKVD